MSIIKSTTQLKELLEREGQIQTTLTSLMPGVRVEDAAHCVLSSGVRGGGLWVLPAKQQARPIDILTFL